MNPDILGGVIIASVVILIVIIICLSMLLYPLIDGRARSNREIDEEFVRHHRCQQEWSNKR